MLAYGLPEGAIDEYIKIGESTALESLKRLCVLFSKSLVPDISDLLTLMMLQGYYILVNIEVFQESWVV